MNLTIDIPADELDVIAAFCADWLAARADSHRTTSICNHGLCELFQRYVSYHITPDMSTVKRYQLAFRDLLRDTQDSYMFPFNDFMSFNDELNHGKAHMNPKRAAFAQDVVEMHKALRS